MSKISHLLAFIIVCTATMVAATPDASASTIVSCDGDTVVFGPWEIPYYPPGTYYAEIIQNNCTLDDGSRCSYDYTESWQLVNGNWVQTNSSIYDNTCPL
jgi:hypothetical protein